jgi:LacI family transcriptional regulator
VEGLIISPGHELLAVLRDYRRHGVPIVAYNGVVPGLAMDTVNTNNTEATLGLVEHLIQIGHRRVGFVGGGLHSLTAEERRMGYEQAMANHGLDTTGLLIDSDFSRCGGLESTERLLSLEPRPTAIVTGNYVMATGMLDALRAAGLALPQDMAVASFGDPDYFAIYRPGITGIRQPVRDIARTCADLLLRRLAGDRSGFPESVRLPSELLLRESTDPASP